MKKNIVIVEDSRLIRKRIEDILDNLNYNVVESFTTGEKAVEMIKDIKVDLIIMDINLAGDMNGYQAARKISEVQDVPLIFLTGSNEIDFNVDESFYQVSLYLSKPFTVDELKNNIEMVLYKYEFIKKTRNINEEQRLLLNNIQNHVWYLIDPVTYGRVNKAHAQFYGYDIREMENKKITDLFSDKITKKLKAFNNLVFSKKEQISKSLWLEDSDGKKRLLSITATPRLDEEENVEFVVCSAQDVTEEREMKEELLEREQRFFSIIATLPDIIVLFNKKGVYQNIWTGHKENLFAEKEKMIGNKFEDIMPQRVAKKIRYHLNQTLKYNELQEFEYQLKVISGKEKYFEARMTAISQNQAVVVVRDITDRKETEKELEVQRAYFKQLFENSPDAITILNTDSEILDINESFSELFGFNEEEIKGEQINDLIIPEGYRDEGYELSEKIIAGEIVQVETLRLNKKGEKIDVFLIAYPIKLDDDQLGMYAMYRDIRDRKTLENNLRESKTKIEKLHEIAIEMETIDNEDDIYRLTVDAAENILNFDVCLLDIVEDGMFVVKARGSGVKVDDIDERAPTNTGIAGKVYQSGESQLTRDVRKESEAEPASNSYRSAMTVPIDEFGIFQVISNNLNEFDEVDLELTELLIAHTSAAIKRIRAERRIKYLGYHDSLTDLYNRAYFEQEMSRLDVDRNIPFSIIIGDLNNLKKVNDKYGHNKGDEVIKRTAEILQTTCREEDILARWGGDEFGLLLPQTDRKTAQKVIARIKNKMKNLSYEDVDVDLALGCATKTDPSQDLNEIFRVADDYMYENKANIKGEAC